LIGGIMSGNPSAKRDAAPSRLRGIISTVLLMMLLVMIVRDIFARRWGSAPPSPPNVTHRSS
jgi:hypothetical protein